jgi:hypothetical protein
VAEQQNLITMRDSKHDAHLLVFLDLIYKQRYYQADSVLQSNITPGEFSFLYFKGLLEVTKFKDFGDTAALTAAEKSWRKIIDSLKKNEKSGNQPPGNSISHGLYKGLTLMQLSYISSVRGQYLSSALHARGAAKLLKNQNQYVEAQCAVQVFKYYKSRLFKLLDWIPFIKVDEKSPRIFLEKNVQFSRYLSVLFTTPLIWMQFDAGLNRQGLKMTKNFLNKYPQHRLYRMIEADFHYKMGNYQEAARIFEAIKAEYLQIYQNSPDIKCIRINYLSTVGNLIRVYDKSGKVDLRDENA